MPQLTAARNAVGLAFVLNGLCFASWVSRIPEARDGFDLSNGGLGVLLLMIAIGSIVALPDDRCRDRSVGHGPGAAHGCGGRGGRARHRQHRARRLAGPDRAGAALPTASASGSGTWP